MTSITPDHHRADLSRRAPPLPAVRLPETSAAGVPCARTAAPGVAARSNRPMLDAVHAAVLLAIVALMPACDGRGANEGAPSGPSPTPAPASGPVSSDGPATPGRLPSRADTDALSPDRGIRAPAARSADDTLTVTGTLSLEARSDIPVNAIAIVDLHHHAGLNPAACAHERIAERRVPLDGTSMPVPFVLAVPADAVDRDCPLRLRALVHTAGPATWMSRDVPVDIAGDAVDLGPLTLASVGTSPFDDRLVCGEQPIAVAPTDSGVRLTVNDRALDLTPVRAASGAKYERAGDPPVLFWRKGQRALVEIGNERYPECTRMAARVPLVARGHEPEWRLEITDARVTLNGLDRELDARFDAPAVESLGAGRRYTASADGRTFEAVVTEHVCNDTMTGMPHPLTVDIRLAGRGLSGCGGDPAWLLTGGVWHVEDLDRGGIIDRSHVTLDFRPDGALVGSAGCNPYTAQWRLTGEGLALTEGVPTGRTCAASLAAQEQRLLDLMPDVIRFQIDRTGRLTLFTADRRTLSARRR